MCLSSAACELPQCITHAELHPSRETRWTPRPLRRRSWKPPSRRPWRASGTMSRSSGTSPCRTALRPSRSGPSAATGDAPWARGSTSGPGSARLPAREQATPSWKLGVEIDTELMILRSASAAGVDGDPTRAAWTPRTEPTPPWTPLWTPR